MKFNIIDEFDSHFFFDLKFKKSQKVLLSSMLTFKMFHVARLRNEINLGIKTRVYFRQFVDFTKH